GAVMSRKIRLISGPPMTVMKCALHRSGGTQYARPPNGHIKISLAVPPVKRQAMQWPNSCISTDIQSAPSHINDISSDIGADEVLLARAHAFKISTIRKVMKRM